MELRVLRYFLTLAREENISRAAEALYITQPTLSRQLAELEEELGAKLFERGKRKITLTEEGLLLRRRAEEMVELEEKLEREFRARGENLAGVISVGAAEVRASGLLAAAIDRFRKKYPEVSFEIYSETADRTKERIDRGVLDLGLLVEPGDIEKYDFLRLGIPDRCGVMMRADHPLAGKESVSVEDLFGRPVIVNTRAEVRRFYRHALGEAYERLNVLASVDFNGNAAYFVEKGLACAVTLEGAMAQYASERLVFRPFAPALAQETYLVWKKYQPMSRAERAFIDEVTMLLPYNEA